MPKSQRSACFNATTHPINISETNTSKNEVVERKRLLGELILKVEAVPREWFNSTSIMINGHTHHEKSVEARDCSKWSVCEAAWVEALQWRKELGDAMSVLLAVCASTAQSGNQLFLDLIGSPGSAKTTLCRALLVSGHCIHLENMTKLISGYKKPGEEEKDCSFLARANGKTWVTCEFDVLGSSPEYTQLMGKVRRIFDGETTATYGNSDVDRIYSALRTPWIRAGTPKMINTDQSQLGDRFNRFMLTDPCEVEKRSITKRAIQLERMAMVERANATSGSIIDPKTRLAYSLTGGYVDWLRANVEDEIAKLSISDAAEDYCIDLADLCSDLRARPQLPNNKNKDSSEAHDYKELPTRLARQNIRMTACLAIVLNKTSVDTQVLRIVRKIALDTAAGHSLNMVRWLCSPRPGSDKMYQSDGLMVGVLEVWTGIKGDALVKYLKFLCKIGVLEMRSHKHMGNSWVLTERVYDLYTRIMEG